MIQNFLQSMDLIRQLVINLNISLYVYTFGVVFIAAWLFGRYATSYDGKYTIIESSIVKFLKNRDLFYVYDSNREEIWLNLLRIVAGYSLLSRSFWIFYYETVIGGTLTRELVSFVDMISSLFLMVGFFTPLFNVILFLFHTYIHDTLLSTFTLGSCLAQILLMIFMFLPAGRRCSIDAYLISTKSVLGSLIKSIYDFFGTPTTNRIAIVKLCAFISYGLLCMYSVYEHFRDPYWSAGIANVMLLSSNWLVAPFELFRYFFITYSKTAIIISMISLYIMMAWEFLIIPFAFMKGITRQFVIWWGLAFFAVSIFILQLSWLPYYQIILFAILFWPGYFLNRDNQSALEVYYDDRCNLCDKTVWLIKKLDWFSVVKLCPMSKCQDLIRSRGLSSDQVYHDLYGYDVLNNRVYGGYSIYVQFSQRILPLVIFYPILMVGKILKIGPLLYSFIAARRRQLFGICTIPSIEIPLPETSTQSPIITQRNYFFAAYLMTYVLFLFVYMINFPYFNFIPGWQTMAKSFQFIGTVPSALNGQIPIKVFTPDVISMGSHYFTVTGVFENGETKLLPYVGPKGERLKLVKSSDRLYFGHALGWRRLMYGKEGENICYDSQRDDRFLLDLFSLAEHVWHVKPKYYKIDYYSQGVPDPQAALKLEYRLPSLQHVCSINAQLKQTDEHQLRVEKLIS